MISLSFLVLLPFVLAVIRQLGRIRQRMAGLQRGDDAFQATQVMKALQRFGIGNGATFQTVFNQFYQQGFVFKERVAHAHNVFLARLVETGIVGLLAFVCFVGGYMQNFWRQFRQAVTVNPLLLAGFVSLLRWLGMGMFDYSLHLTQITRAVWIMCGLTVVAGRLFGVSNQVIE